MLPYLPMYNAHPYFEACFQKKKAFQHHSWHKLTFWKNSAGAKSSSTCTKISYRSWCKSFTVLSVQWYIKFYVFLIFFCCFAAAWSNAIICTMPVTFLWTRSPGTRLAATMVLRRRFARSFLFQIFPHLFKIPKNKWVDRTSTKPKGKFFMEFTLSSKYSRKCNRFSIVIVNKLHDWCHDRQGLKWCTYKARQTFCLDLFLLVA